MRGAFPVRGRAPGPAPGNTRRAGSKTERRARRHYRLRGYRVLGQNVWIGGYELALVLRRGASLVFCEVKGKSGTGFGDPLEMVTPEKVGRVRRAAHAWLAAHPEHPPIPHLEDDEPNLTEETVAPGGTAEANANIGATDPGSLVESGR